MNEMIMGRKLTCHIYLLTILALFLLLFSCSNEPANNNDLIGPLTLSDLTNLVTRNSKELIEGSRFIVKASKNQDVEQLLNSKEAGIELYLTKDSSSFFIEKGYYDYENNLKKAILLSEPIDKGSMQYYSSNIPIDSLSARLKQLEFIYSGYEFEGVRLDRDNFSEVRTQLLLSILNAHPQNVFSVFNGKERFYLFMEYHHSIPAITAQYFYLIEDAYNNGLLNEELYALALDRVLSFAGFKQVYGSQVFDGEWVEVEDLSRMDSLRNSAGMENIDEYLKRFSIDFSVVRG